MPKNWVDKGMVKTTYILVVNRGETRSIGRNWILLEEPVPLNSFTKIDDVYESLQLSEQDDIQIVKMICILHSYVDEPAGFKDYDEMPVNHTAHVTCKDLPMFDEAWNGDKLACFYCGEQQVMILDTCAKCDKHMCHACLDVTEDAAVVISQTKELSYSTALRPIHTKIKSQRSRRSRKEL